MDNIQLSGKIKKIKLVILDVDGVLTDGRIIYDSKGRDSKFFDVHDGLGVYLLGQAGIKTILLTAKGSGTLKHRAKDMRVEEIYADAVPKTSALDKIVKKYSVSDIEICFVGDDLVDLSVMKRVGLPIAVANACDEVKEIAAYVTKKQGGRGAVREAAELILKSQGKWEIALKIFNK
ncbi:MAG: HAD-IIIA family hydrolase [Candidatus Omnitrophota bacterium]|nr:HAD-IIIA family hydrolase [Candidatus Omnitrophota bacterium]